jgi:hypothetical protein
MMRDGDQVRYVRFDSSPPRQWQTGDRRSPPSSETAESRRRTRARFNYARASPPSAPNNGGSSASPTHPRPNSFAGVSSSQQNPLRERNAQPPFMQIAWHGPQANSRRSVTPLTSRQNVAGHGRPGGPMMRPHHTLMPSYPSVAGGSNGQHDVLASGSSTTVSGLPLPSGPSHGDSHDPFTQPPLTLMVAPPMHHTAILPGPASMASFNPNAGSAPSRGPQAASSFPHLSSQANSQPLTNANGW